MEFIKELREEDLVELVSAGLDISRDDLKKYTVEALGSRLPAYEHPGDSFFEWPAYWKSLKEEFHILVCTNDKKYKSLRDHLAKTADRSHSTVVATIAAAMAASLGLTAGVLVPFCALCLVALLRLGKEAYFKNVKLDIPVKR